MTLVLKLLIELVDFFTFLLNLLLTIIDIENIFILYNKNKKLQIYNFKHKII